MVREVRVTAAQIERELARMGKRRETAKQHLAALHVELVTLVRNARALGIPYRRITELTGLSARDIRAWTRVDDA